MDLPTARTVGTVALGLSLLTFAVFFLNVLLGGPLGHKPWMSDVGEMLTLFTAVAFFVAGTLARESESYGDVVDEPTASAMPDSN